jgi:cyclophilin family peptidyl-prolyl cis-trans isomerase/preprotein translocase subunit SecF
MFGIVEKRTTYLIAAGALVLAAAAAIVAAQTLSGFLTPSDATGSLASIKVSAAAVDEESIRSFFAAQGYGPVIVQRVDSAEEGTFQVRTAVALPDDPETWVSPLERELGAVDRDTLYVYRVHTTGSNLAPAGSTALVATAVIAFLATWWFASRLPGSLRYAGAAAAGLLHAVVLALGFCSLVVLVAGWKVRAAYLLASLGMAALLAIQAMLVILDRVRANRGRYGPGTYATLLVRSTVEAIHPVLVTLVCVAVPAVALLAARSEAVTPLAATVLFGSASATYSSFFVFVPLLLGAGGRAVPRAAATSSRRARQRKERRAGAEAGRPRLWVWIILAAVAILLVWVAVPRSTMPSNPAERNEMYSEPPEMTIEPSSRYLATFDTEKGVFVVELYADRAPNTVNNFVFLAREGFYDGTTFHRVIPDFMAQGGDPTGTGAGGPGYVIEDEFHPELKHDQPGALSMANRGLPATGSSQFFITYEATPWLDAYDESGQLKDCSSAQVACHAVFGQVIEGFDVVESLTARDPDSNPGYEGDLILSVRITEE